MDINSLTSISSTTIHLAKEITDIALSSKNADLQGELLQLSDQLLEVTSRLLEAKEEIANLTAENDWLIKRIKDLERKDGSQVIVRGRLYYKRDGAGPFCNTCCDTRQQLVRMKNLVGTAFKCPVCSFSLMVLS